MKKMLNAAASAIKAVSGNSVKASGSLLIWFHHPKAPKSLLKK